MWRLPKKFVVLLVAAIVVGGLALAGSSSRSTTSTPAPSEAAPDQAAVASWQAFQAHLGSALPVLETDMNAVANGGTAGYITAQSSALDAARADALTEVAWLQANPAAPCYAAVYGDYLSANQTLETAMADAISGDYATANALIGQLNTSLAKLATDTPKTAC
jgi:outer membrane murein-binding lipoprotein Lpp